MSCEELATVFSELGFSRSVVSALKVRVDGNVSDGSYVWRKSVLGDDQLHVMFHEVDGHVEVYAHWERSCIRHPVGHVKKEGLSTELGVETTRTLLSESSTDEHPDSIPFEVESLFWRSPWYFDPDSCGAMLRPSERMFPIRDSTEIAAFDVPQSILK